MLTYWFKDQKNQCFWPLEKIPKPLILAFEANLAFSKSFTFFRAGSTWGFLQKDQINAKVIPHFTLKHKEGKQKIRKILP